MTNRSKYYIVIAMEKMKKKISPAELDHKARRFEQLCRQAGLKVTPQRVEIYKELVRSSEHPSAEMLHRKVSKIFPNISLDTVNSELSHFLNHYEKLYK